jgi:hypothetical protein
MLEFPYILLARQLVAIGPSHHPFSLTTVAGKTSVNQ